MKNWSTYLLKCSDNSLYCGVTNDLKKRLASHNQGTASKYTRSRIPVKLAAVRNKLSKSEAFKLEYIIKRTRTDKKIKTLLNWNFSDESG
ncbi:MAG: GIY-YIG nuclease family protein [Desulfobacterales bacterium]|nr:GIY-YIG nuclease family protein [Desulfobacterales bacterium]